MMHTWEHICKHMQAPKHIHAGILTHAPVPRLTHTDTHASTHSHTNTYMCMDTHTPTCLHMDTHAPAHTYISMHAHTQTCMHTHTHTHSDCSTHTHLAGSQVERKVGIGCRGTCQHLHTKQRHGVVQNVNVECQSWYPKCNTLVMLHPSTQWHWVKFVHTRMRNQTTQCMPETKTHNVC